MWMSRRAGFGDFFDVCVGWRFPTFSGMKIPAPLLWEQLSRANRVRFWPPAVRIVSLVSSSSPFCRVAPSSEKSVVSSSYSQSAAFAALASYSPSSGVQSRARTSVLRGHPAGTMALVAACYIRSHSINHDASGPLRRKAAGSRFRTGISGLQEAHEEIHPLIPVPLAVGQDKCYSQEEAAQVRSIHCEPYSVRAK